MAGERHSPVRFGILGCAEIARKVSRAITLAPNASLYAVASRSIDKARQFAETNSFPASSKIYGSYRELLDDADVDAVYVPLPTSLHVQWAVEVARKGKHLLLEKPVALSVAEFDLIVEACEDVGVQLMDGTMWMHHPRTHNMKEFLSDDQRFGRLNTIYSCFSYLGDANFLTNDVRVSPDLDALGVLGDAGWYCVRASLWAADYHLPKQATALHGAVFNNSGVLLSCGGSLLWEDGKQATFHCSFLTHIAMTIAAFGSKGTLHLNDFVIPQDEKSASFVAASGVKWGHLSTGWSDKPTEHVVENGLPQEASMVEEFARLVSGIKWDGLKPEKKWPVLSRKTQAVVDAVKASIDRGYVPVEILY